MAEEEDKGSKDVTVEEVSLEVWSTRVEDLLDKGDEEGAVKLLEGVIAKLSLAKNGESNLGLAAAMSDLGSLYGTRGMSLKADQLLSDSLLVRKRAEGKAPRVEDEDLSWEDVAEESINSKVGDKQSGSSHRSHSDRVQGARNPCTAAVSDEDDWEAAAVLPPVAHKTTETTTTTPKQKQRGRGAFTYGGSGNLYSDQTEEDRMALHESSSGAGNDHWDGGAEHVLLIDGFSPLTQTKDLEDLLRPYSSKVSIRWIDDTSAAAVFRTPALARQALAGLRDPRFKVHKYTEAAAGAGNLISLSVADLEPPAPRPATTARVAQRMIAGALSRQGISSQSLRAKTKANAEQALAEEAARKQRLLNRQQLRDEAWGDD